ncbi:vesicle transport protein GOT1-like [Typha angustifolia]|uniref:vesicle transport protein GOT1-like n=1 Tax=Typha angustifolia TaxID=59011 RepID=UPI003C2D119E
MEEPRRVEREIGLGLIVFGILFSLVASLFFFQRNVLAFGNIIFVIGVILMIGRESVMRFFIKPKNYKGAVLLGVGFLIVLMGWLVTGIILEASGLLALLSRWLLERYFATLPHYRYKGKRRAPV